MQLGALTEQTRQSDLFGLKTIHFELFEPVLLRHLNYSPLSRNSSQSGGSTQQSSNEQCFPLVVLESETCHLSTKDKQRQKNHHKCDATKQHANTSGSLDSL
jgi:hypothetical protein